MDPGVGSSVYLPTMSWLEGSLKLLEALSPTHHIRRSSTSSRRMPWERFIAQERGGLRFVQ